MKTESELYQFYKTDLLEELKALDMERRAILNKLKITFVIIVSIIVIVILFLIPGAFVNVQMCLFTGTAGLAIFGFLYKMFTSGFVRIFKDKIVNRIIKFLDGNLTYSPEEYIDKSKFELSRIFIQSVNKYSGDDLVSGRIDKTNIEFSEINAKHETRDSKGRTHTTTIFHGLFFIADFNKNFNGSLVVVPDTAQSLLGKFGQTLQSINIFRGRLIKLEDPEFEKLFAVYGDNQVEARYILSTSLMSRITEFKKKTNKKIYLSFLASKIFVAIDYNRDLFEPKIWSQLTDFEPIKEYFRDLTTAIGIVEDLNLNLRIWSKN